MRKKFVVSNPPVKPREGGGGGDGAMLILAMRKLIDFE